MPDLATCGRVGRAMGRVWQVGAPARGQGVGGERCQREEQRENCEEYRSPQSRI
ncbi:MAG: hypothetical protein HY784_16090 [Chloroflexi bacterium]|nr:hypothetical protein [Chloroflexota bacterium]